ncbi:hypothetical protein Lal_00026444 [Lupinus albus]|nr:hypothetical protein Lal_00026444 [Lupinus albus]
MPARLSHMLKDTRRCLGSLTQVSCCMWVDNKNDFRDDELGFMQVQQGFYVSDPADMKWSIVLLTNKIIVNNIDDQENEDIYAEDNPFFYEITIA